MEPQLSELKRRKKKSNNWKRPGKKKTLQWYWIPEHSVLLAQKVQECQAQRWALHSWCLEATCHFLFPRHWSLTESDDWRLFILASALPALICSASLPVTCPAFVLLRNLHTHTRTRKKKKSSAPCKPLHICGESLAASFLLYVTCPTFSDLVLLSLSRPARPVACQPTLTAPPPPELDGSLLRNLYRNWDVYKRNFAKYVCVCALKLAEFISVAASHNWNEYFSESQRSLIQVFLMCVYIHIFIYIKGVFALG